MGDLQKASANLTKILDLVKQGVLGRELMPEPDYWHWPILKPDKIPDDLKMFVHDDEMRF